MTTGKSIPGQSDVLERFTKTIKCCSQDAFFFLQSIIIVTKNIDFYLNRRSNDKVFQMVVSSYCINCSDK